MPEGPENSGIIERKLATILSADVAGFSRLMGENEEETLRIFRSHKKVFESLVTTHRGRIFNTAGDAILAEFTSAVEAVRCATDVQSALRTRNDQLPPERQVRFRIGINLGDVMIQGQDLLGDGVNVAARLQTAAEPGGICISGSVHDQIRNKLSLSFHSLGEKTFKNIQQPVRTFSIVEGEGTGPLPSPKPSGTWKGPVVWAAVGLLIVAGGGYAAYVAHERGKADNAPATATVVQPQPVPSETAAPKPVSPETKKPTAPQAQPSTIPDSHKAASTANSPKPIAKPEEPSSSAPEEKSQPNATSAVPAAPASDTHPGRYDGVYTGPVCSGKTPNLPAHCYPAEGTIHGSKITGSWPTGKDSGLTMTLEGEVTPTGEVTILMHSERADGTRQATINLSGTVRGGLLEATGNYLNGRSANLNWHLKSDTPH